MTLQELIMAVSTATYCHFYVRCIHRGLVYADIGWLDIPVEYRNMQVHSAVPTKCSFGAIKEWHICLNDCSIRK